MNIEVKMCSKCNTVKSLDEFYVQKSGYLNRRANCKECCRLDVSKRQKNRDKNYYKNYYNKNKIIIRENSLRYYNKNKEVCKQNSRNYYKKNSKELKEYSRNHYKKNSKELKEYNKQWRKNNQSKCRKYARDRYKKSLELSVVKWMRNFLYRTEHLGFNKTKMNTIIEFGYTPKQLIQRIECQFKIGMGWNNRNEWHIDHKKPISSFKSGSSPKLINMLSNLQPIWKHDNLSKGCKF